MKKEYVVFDNKTHRTLLEIIDLREDNKCTCQQNLNKIG